MVLTVLQDEFEFSIFMSVNGMDRPCSTLKLQYWSSEHGKEYDHDEAGIPSDDFDHRH